MHVDQHITFEITVLNINFRKNNLISITNNIYFVWTVAVTTNSKKFLIQHERVNHKIGNAK